MRILFTLCILSVSICCFSQHPDSSAKFNSLSESLSGTMGCGIVQMTKKDTAKLSVRVRYCNTTLQSGDEPLFVIDGAPYETIKLSGFNPDTIDSIFILKGSTALALYGSAGAHGVIIITTKKAKLRTFIIKDFMDGSLIAGATISFISADKKDSFMYAADDSGMVIADKLKSGVTYQMNVSSVNYKNFNRPYKSIYNAKQEEVLLERSIKTCDEVILGGIVISCGRLKSLSWSCGVPGVTVIMANYDSIVTGPSISGIKIYPNPVQRGGTINFQLNNDGKNKTIRLISLDGKQLMQKLLLTSKGNTVFPITTENRWSSGIYFLQIICEKGRVLASEKIIIQ